MSLKYGLNVKGAKAPPAPRRPVLEDEDDEEEQAAPPTHAPPRKAATGKPPGRKPQTLPDAPEADISSIAASEGRVKAAQNVDPTIFDYDSFHDAKSTVTEAKKAAQRQEAIERKPKYINNLLDAAARRKQDQLVAKEKLLQKEREAEGDEFADKEKFVTGAYKEQQVEARKLEEEERKKAEEEKRKKRVGGGGMQGFYRSMMDQNEKLHQEALEAAEKAGKEGTAKDGSSASKDESDAAADLRAKGVHLNEEGQIIDKRELLSAGLNVGGSGGSKRSAEHLKVSKDKPAASAFAKPAGNVQASRERQTRMMEEQLAERTKRAREEEEAEHVKLEQAAKTQKTDTDKMSARERYLARKAAKERGEA